MDKVRHVSRPSEPFGSEGAIGRITRTRSVKANDGREIGPLRITPAVRGIPAQAHVDWGDYCTWEKLSDLVFMGKDRQGS